MKDTIIQKTRLLILSAIVLATVVFLVSQQDTSNATGKVDSYTPSNISSSLVYEPPAGQEFEVTKIEDQTQLGSGSASPQAIQPQSTKTAYPQKNFYISSQNGLEEVKFRFKFSDGSYSNEYDAKPTEELASEQVQNSPIVSILYSVDQNASVELINPQGKNVSIRYVDNSAQATEAVFQGADYYDQAVDFENEYTNRLFRAMGFDIYTREEWGAPSYSLWHPTVTQVNKIIIHHTAINFDPADLGTNIRLIYNYHKYRCSYNSGSYPDSCPIEETWQDIGYNYVIDPFGNIYEGRTGGIGSVGAHAYLSNYGSIGIAIMGDYSSVEPSAASLNTLKRLLAAFSSMNQLDLVWGTSVFGHRDMPNNLTACPGAKFYPMLPGIVTEANTLRTSFGGINNVVDLTNSLVDGKEYKQELGLSQIVLQKSGLDNLMVQKMGTTSRGVTDILSTERSFTYFLPDELIKPLLTQTLLVIPDAKISPNYVYIKVASTEDEVE